MHYILKSLKDNFQLSKPTLKELATLMVKENYLKKDFLIKEGKTNSNYYFIESGLARFYLMPDGKEITNWFFKEGDVTFSMAGVYYNKPSYGYIQFLEDSEVYRVASDKLNSLFETDLELCNFSRKMYQKTLFDLEYRYFRLKETPAAERYSIFCQENPSLSNRIGLGHLASYLGMSQVTLSRVRSQKYPHII